MVGAGSSQRVASIATVLRLSAAVGRRDGTSTAVGRMFFQIKPIQSVRYRSWTPTEWSIVSTTTLGDWAVTSYAFRPGR